MTADSGSQFCDRPLSLVADLPAVEQEQHKQFIFRHVDFLIDILTGEQIVTGGNSPAGCPNATPETIARRKKQGDTTACRYRKISETDLDERTENNCPCGDPLCGSDDPLDTVAAVVIASETTTVSSRYFDYEWRQIIRGLRDRLGTWEQIADLDRNQLTAELEDLTNRPGINESRVTRLYRLLEAVDKLSLTDSITLSGISPVPYESLCKRLTGFPSISQQDGWWLLLTAFDKPVWPADPILDRLLCTLGLLSIEALDKDRERHTEIEDRLTDRQIPELFRAVASHAKRGGADICGKNCEIRKFLLTHRARCQANSEAGPVAVDLFAGAGGLSLGFSRAGCQIELAIDYDRVATDTYRLNHPEIPHSQVLCEDIREISNEQLREHVYKNIDIVIGGPPCQALSQAGYRSRLADNPDYSILDDRRTTLYTQYVETLRELSPKMIVMENVEGLVNEVNETGERVVDEVLTALEAEGYQCDYCLLDCSKLGIPQRRERVIIMGIQKDILSENNDTEKLFDDLFKITPDAEYTLKQALSGIPKILRSEGGRVYPQQKRGAPSEYVAENNLQARTALTFNHRAREHPKSKDRELFDKAMSPGDTGWEIKHHSKYGHLIDYDVGTKKNPRFKDKYRMLYWDRPAPTVVAHLAKDANNFLIPDYYKHVSQRDEMVDRRRNRGVTPREAARIQSFPDDYIFLGTFTQWFRQIGNAVPPILGEALGKVIYSGQSEASVSEMSWDSCPAVSTDD